MSTLKLVGAVALLSTTLATPVLAQHVIYDPAFCAFYYPNANCQNEGPGNPYTDPNYRRGTAQHDRTSPGGAPVGVAGKKSRTANPPAIRMQ